ncbi:hypothetical protein Ciccas_001089 [Cichlidogyrus casuarinus]|uniref:Uncharacterized protein n=1 Tax=Cichlidogyrus casuarinus TaxID=1844966 RepID=A0ABD2QNC4_9PLAT
MVWNLMTTMDIMNAALSECSMRIYPYNKGPQPDLTMSIIPPFDLSCYLNRDMDNHKCQAEVFMDQLIVKVNRALIHFAATINSQLSQFQEKHMAKRLRRESSTSLNPMEFEKDLIWRPKKISAETIPHLIDFGLFPFLNFMS